MAECGTVTFTARGSAALAPVMRRSTDPLRPKLAPVTVTLMGVPSTSRPEVGPELGLIDAIVAAAYV